MSFTVQRVLLRCVTATFLELLRQYRVLPTIKLCARTHKNTQPGGATGFGAWCLIAGSATILRHCSHADTCNFLESFPHQPCRTSRRELIWGGNFQDQFIPGRDYPLSWLCRCDPISAASILPRLDALSGASSSNASWSLLSSVLRDQSYTKQAFECNQ